MWIIFFFFHILINTQFKKCKLIIVNLYILWSCVKSIIIFLSACDRFLVFLNIIIDSEYNDYTHVFFYYYFELIFFFLKLMLIKLIYVLILLKKKPRGHQFILMQGYYKIVLKWNIYVFYIKFNDCYQYSKPKW